MLVYHAHCTAFIRIGALHGIYCCLCDRLSPESDLTKVLVKAVRELAEPEGSNLRAVEKFLQTVYEIEVEQVRYLYRSVH
jgi:hypothetical protein